MKPTIEQLTQARDAARRAARFPSEALIRLLQFQVEFGKLQEAGYERKPAFLEPIRLAVVEIIAEAQRVADAWTKAVTPKIADYITAALPEAKRQSVYDCAGNFGACRTWAVGTQVRQLAGLPDLADKLHPKPADWLGFIFERLREHEAGDFQRWQADIGQEWAWACGRLKPNDTGTPDDTDGGALLIPLTEAAEWADISDDTMRRRFAGLMPLPKVKGTSRRRR